MIGIVLALLVLQNQHATPVTWGPFTLDVAAATDRLAVAEVGRMPRKEERFIFVRVRVKNVGQHWFCAPFRIRLRLEGDSAVDPLEVFMETSEPRWPKIPSLSVGETGEGGYLFSVPISVAPSALVFERRGDDRNRCQAERAWPFVAADRLSLELLIKELSSTQPVTVDSAGRYVVKLGSLQVSATGVRRLPEWSESGRTVHPRDGYDFAVVDFLAKNAGELPNCTVFNATLKTDFFGEVTTERSSDRRGLERLPTGDERTVSAVFEINRQRQPLGVILSSYSDDSCRSAFQPRLPDAPAIHALVPLSH
jgi:hypothetical protein